MVYVAYVALAEAAILTVVIVSFTSLLRSKDRSHARREDLLLNQLLHAVDKPWQEAPAAASPPVPVEHRDPDEVLPTPSYRRFTTSPEQEP